MSAPWIEAWKAWLARGAELFTKPGAPDPGKARRAAPVDPPSKLHDRPGERKTEPHRSGQRHG